SRMGQMLMRWAASTYESSTSEAIAGVLASYLRPEGTVHERESVVIRRACEAIRLAARERPILISLISADQADLQTKTFLYHLARSLDETPFPGLVLLTYTEDERGPVRDARQLLGALDRVGAPLVEKYRLAPLSDDATSAFLRTFAQIDDETIEHLGRCAQGNPLMARELLLYQQKGGAIVHRDGIWTLSDVAQPATWPRSLADVFVRRCMLTVAGLPDAHFVGQVLVHMAVLGDAAEHGLIVDFLLRRFEDEARIYRALETLLKAQIVVDQRGATEGLRFAHPILRGALLSHTSADQQAQLDAAEALLVWYGAEAGRYGDSIAEHFAAAGDPVLAGHWYAETGQMARNEGRTADARAFLERAAVLMGRGDPSRETARRHANIWLQLSEIDLARGDDHTALTHAQKAAHWANQAGEATVAAQALLLIGDAMRRRGALEEAAAAYRDAATEFDQLGDQHGIGKCLLGQAFAESSLRRFDRAGQLFEQARAPLHAANDARSEARAVRGCAEIALRQGKHQIAGRHLQAARALFAACEDRRGEVACIWLLGETCRLLGRSSDAIAHYQAARAGYVSQGNLAGMARSDVHLARLYAGEDRWSQASASFAQAARTHGELGELTAADAVWAEWVRGCLARSAFADALTPTRARLTHAMNTQDRSTETIARAQLAWVAAESGDAVTCRNELRAAVALDRVLDVRHADLAAAFDGLAGVFARYGHAHRGATLQARASQIRQDLEASSA
ncbi:MAG: tetratricopeptide (TPR) repeat protein, partial [Bradymonadia bacterium]